MAHRRRIRPKDRPREIADPGTVMSGREGESLWKFFLHEIRGTHSWKWVGVAKGDCWAGDWYVNGRPCFLLKIREMPMSLVKLYKSDPDRAYFVYATGTDDYSQAKRDLTLVEALDLFRAIEDNPYGVSRLDLSNMGVVAE